MGTAIPQRSPHRMRDSAANGGSYVNIVRRIGFEYTLVRAAGRESIHKMDERIEATVSDPHS